MKQTQNEPSANSTDEADIVVHNYDAMNSAIDRQAGNHIQLTEIYRFEEKSRRTLMLMHGTISLCVILVTVGILWWLYVQSQVSYTLLPPSKVNDIALNEQADSHALENISRHQDIARDEQAFINTSFTIFHRTTTPSGEVVVTGKNYDPDDLKNPSEQYCYLENAQANGMSGTPLASQSGKQAKLKIETKDDLLKDYVQLYCQFSR